jgi:hypothetical protein
LVRSLSTSACASRPSTPQIIQPSPIQYDIHIRKFRRILTANDPELCRWHPSMSSEILLPDKYQATRVPQLL